MSEPTSETQDDKALALLRLSETASNLCKEISDAADLETAPESEDEFANDNSPLFSAFVLAQVDPVFTCRKLTNFTLDQFQNLHDILHDSVVVEMFCGRGRKCVDSTKDMLFMLLASLKHGGE